MKRGVKPTGCYLGAACELAVCADLLRKGFDVFRNVSPNGISDLVIMKAGHVLTVQVKSRGGGSQWERMHNDIIATYNDGDIRYSIEHPSYPNIFSESFGAIEAARRSVRSAFDARKLACATSTRAKEMKSGLPSVKEALLYEETFSNCQRVTRK
jgi:hypothetical protein